MRLATFNIFWLGDEEQITRDGDDIKRLARIIAKVDADVFAFQEIVDPVALGDILNDAAVERRYAMQDLNNNLLGTGGGQAQMVVIAYDDKLYELLEASAIRRVGHTRPPYGVRLRRRSDGAQVTVVNVHFQSGWPDFTDQNDANTRRGECQRLVEWVGGELENPGFRSPAPDEHVVLLGDFNALYDSNNPAHDVVVRSLDPLRRLTDDGWRWEKPLADPNGGGRVSSYIDGYLIDHVLLSPSLRERVSRPPTIYAFDRDPEIDASGTNISDHRPVFVEVDV